MGEGDLARYIQELIVYFQGQDLVTWGLLALAAIGSIGILKWLVGGRGTTVVMPPERTRTWVKEVPGPHLHVADAKVADFSMPGVAKVDLSNLRQAPQLDLEKAQRLHIPTLGLNPFGGLDWGKARELFVPRLESQEEEEDSGE